MNEQFYALSREKQLRIINAGLEVFAQNDYKHAVTDDIARKAGISKGLLFYYFHNKKALYLYLLDYSRELISGRIVNETYRSITDFFDLLEYAAKEKVAVLEQYPYLTDFIMTIYYAEQETVQEDVNRALNDIFSTQFDNYFSHVDYSRFKDGVSVREVYDMLVWLTEGYLYNLRKFHRPLVLSDIMDKFCLWERRLKKMVYKEEYQDTQEDGLWEQS